MLNDADELARQLLGSGNMLQNRFAHPDPRAAVKRAGVWFTAYPLSFVTRPGQSFLSGLAEPSLWQAFAQIGIDAPTKKLSEPTPSPSVTEPASAPSKADRQRRQTPHEAQAAE